MTYAWAPALTDVAAWVPTRTLPVDQPGIDVPIGTFTAATTPTDTQVMVFITAATEYVAARTGTIQTAAQALAKSAAAARAAAAIELANPIRDKDTSVAAALQKTADQLLDALIAANIAAGGTPATPAATAAPAYQFPDPAPWGDTLIL